MKLTVPLFVVAVLATTSAVAAEQPEALTLAIVQFGRGDVDEAKRLLDVAEGEATDPVVLAHIARQRGIVLQVEGDRALALREFLRALYFDADQALPPREHAGDVVRLFACAERLHARGVKGAAIAANHADALALDDWHCPGDPPPPVVQTPAPPPSASLVRPVVARTAEEPDEIWASPWLWVVAGIAVAGAAATTIAVASSDSSYGGTTGVTLQLPGK